MNNNGVIFICFLCLFLLLCGVVSASDVNCTSDDLSSHSVDDVKIDEDVLSAENTTNNLASENTNDQILKDSNTGTFTELSNVISSSSTGIIKLTKDYAYDSSTDSAFANGIVIGRDGISINGLGHTISGSDSARIFQITSSGVLLKDIIFTHAKFTSDNGACIKLIGTDGQLLRCTFDNSEGTAVHLTGQNPSITNCVFKNNHVTSNIPALYVQAKNSKVTGCTFENNRADGYYSALAINQPDGLISNCVFKNNHCNDRGALYINTDHIEVVGCTFIGNTANVGGGALYTTANSQYSSIHDCTFDGNSAKNYGAIQMAGSPNYVNIYNCIFKNNKATNGHGGALQYASFGGSVINCTFISNSATNYGGGFYCALDTAVSLEDSYFYNNSANIAGAAFISSGNMRVDNCTFVENKANAAGAVRTQNPIFNSRFINNVALTGNGGAVSLQQSGTKILRNCEFINNKADSGGAIYSNSVGVLLEYCNFINNSARTDGGAIWINQKGMGVKYSNFTDNVAGNLGGAIYNTGDYFTEYECIFKDNTAKYHTNAMYLPSGLNVCIDYTNPLEVNSTDYNLLSYELTVTNTDTTSAGSASDVTLTYALNNIANYGTIYINPGTYYIINQVAPGNGQHFSLKGNGEAIFDFSNYPNAGSPISLAASGSFDIVNIILKDASTKATSSNTIITAPCKYCNVINCTFDDTYKISNPGREWRFINCIIKNYNHNWVPSAYSYHECHYINCTFKDNKVGPCMTLGVNMWEVINCTFINNAAGAISNTGSDNKIINCTFINNTRSTNGAAIYLTSLAEISGCYFEGNTANNGGAVWSSTRDLNINDCIFINNSAVNGGSVYNTGLYLTITGSSFRFNKVDGDGGAIWNSGDSLVFKNCNVTDNRAVMNGGVYSTGNDIEIINSIFRNNSAENGGGLYSGGNDVEISSSRFTDNDASNGSAIMLGEDSNMHIQTTYFNNNSGLNNTVYLDYGSLLTVDISSTNLPKIDTRGPGTYNPTMKLIYVDNYDSYIREGTLENPTSLLDALLRVSDEGEIRILNGTYVILSPIVIEDKSFNITGWNSSNVYISNPLFTINYDNVRFINLHFIDIDEDIVWLASGGVIKSCSFKGTATNAHTSYISVDGDSFSIVDSNFTGFKHYHNILFTSLDSILIKNCVFEYNLAYNNVNDYILDLEGAESSIINSNFTDNNMKLIKFGGNLTYTNLIDNCLMENNTVSVNDGSLIFINSFNSQIVSSNFTSNVAGSVVSVNGTGFSFSKCLFKDNLGLYGGAIYLTKDAVVLNSTFVNNSAVNGSAIYYSGDSSLGVVDCTFAVPKFDENNNIVEGYIYSNIDVNLTRITFSFTDLKHAVDKANDTLDLEFNYRYFSDYDYNLINGVLIDKSLTVDGNGHVLDGCGESRILLIKSSDSSDLVSLYNLTFVNGKGQYGEYASGYSGKDVVAGAISNFNPIYVENCTFINNTAKWGGAIYNGARATIVECIFTNNSADGGSGGAIGTARPLNVTYSTFNYNPSNSYNDKNGCIYVTSTCTGVYINYNVFACATAIYKNYDLEVEDISNNWWRCNDPTFTYLNDSDPLQARLNFVSVTKVGDDYVYVFNVTFHNGAGDLIPVPWVRTVNYTVTDLNSVIGGVVGLTTNTSWSSNKVLWNLSAMVDDQNLTPYLYPYLALQCLIDYSNANSTLNLCHDYTYSPVVDANNLPNGIVIDKKIIIEGNEHCIDGVSNGTCRAFYITANDVAINNLTIKNSIQLRDNAGAILWTGNNGVIANSTLKNNGDGTWGYCRGGAIYWSGNNATIYNCDFTGNTVGLGGSAIWLTGNYANITSSNFTGGSSNGWGGTLVLNSAEYCTVSDCIFKNTYSAATGGAIHQYNSECNNMVVLNTQFIDCYARDSAGGLTISSPDAYVYNCTFNNCLHNNYASSDDVYGGAVYWSGVNGQLLNSTFTGNYLRHQFSRGINGYGGAVAWAGLNGTLSYCNFTGNYIENAFSVRDGGAVYWSGSDGNINYCNFTNHNVINGGAVFISGSCLVNESVFVDNHATNGGAVYISGFGLISNTDFKDNTAVNGGAVYSTNNITVISSDLTNNSADYGGAIYLLDGHSTILDTTFEDNHAINGSAIYIVTSVNHWYNLDFINNVASTNATVYFREDSTVYSDNLTFTGNVIPNGLHIVGENHIYSPRIYVNQTHPGFGIIMIEPTSMEWAVDNILDNGVIIICSDYTLETIIRMNNLTNVTVTGNHTLRNGKYLFILPIIQKYIKKKQIVF